MLLGGTNANLTIDDSLKTALGGDASSRPSAVKVAVDPAAERLTCPDSIPRGGAPAEVFEAAAKLLEDTVPCLLLICLEGAIDGAGVADWAMVAWTPSDSPVKLRMLCASSRRTLRDEFSDIRFQEYNATEKDEVSLAAYIESTRERTERDRHEAMTQDELDQEEVRKQIEIERASKPKMLAGMTALQVKVQPSFDESLAKLLATPQVTVCAKLSGASGEELVAEVIEGAATPKDLQGRFPASEPCYLVLACPPSEGETTKKLVLVSWMPEDGGVKARMKASTFKASVIDRIKEISGSNVTTAEASCEEDLDESLIQAKSSPPAVAEHAATLPATGPRPPPGGFALPGLGGGGANLQAQLKARTEARGGGYSEQPAAAPQPSLFTQKEKVEKAIFEEKAHAPDATPAAVPPEAAAPSATPAEVVELTLEELQDANVWREKNIVATEKERYLPDSVFASLFGMDKEAFAKLPKWKRDNKKKEHGLF